MVTIWVKNKEDEIPARSQTRATNSLLTGKYFTHFLSSASAHGIEGIPRSRR